MCILYGSPSFPCVVSLAAVLAVSFAILVPDRLIIPHHLHRHSLDLLLPPEMVNYKFNSLAIQVIKKQKEKLNQ
jgi:hypothetical protein